MLSQQNMPGWGRCRVWLLGLGLALVADRFTHQ